MPRQYRTEANQKTISAAASHHRPSGKAKAFSLPAQAKSHPPAAIHQSLQLKPSTASSAFTLSDNPTLNQTTSRTIQPFQLKPPASSPAPVVQRANNRRRGTRKKRTTPPKKRVNQATKKIVK